MDRQGTLNLARVGILAGSLLLLLVLALEWWHVTKVMTGFSVEGGTAGRDGIGMLAVACAAVLLVSELIQRDVLKPVRALLAVGALAGVVASAATGSATAEYAGAVVTETSTLTWAAYAAIAIALVLVAATFVEALVAKPARLALPPFRRAQVSV